MLRNIFSRLGSRIGRRGRQPQARRNGQFHFRQGVERLEDRTLLANDLFVIAHGYVPGPFFGFPAWVYDMATAINHTLPTPNSTYDDSDADSIPESFERSRVDWNGDLSPIASAASTPSEWSSFLLFNWQDQSNNRAPYSQDYPSSDIESWAQAAGIRLGNEVLRKLGQSSELVDIHFIGHSRGAVVVSEAIKQIAANAIASSQLGFVQMTTLDPHPVFDGEDGLNGSVLAPNFEYDDPRVTVTTSIVDFADNYFQLNHYPKGDNRSQYPLPNAVNVVLSEPLRIWDGHYIVTGGDHTEVHDWYHWTIDLTDYPPSGNPYSEVPLVNGTIRDELFTGITVVGPNGNKTFSGPENVGFQWSQQRWDYVSANFGSARSIQVSAAGATEISERVFPMRDVDMYQFEATVNGRVTIDLSAGPIDSSESVLFGREFDGNLKVYDADHQLVGNNDNNGDNVNSHVEVEVLQGRTYYIQASGYGNSTGPYTLQMLPIASPDDFGNTFTTAATVSLSNSGSGTQSGRIEEEGDVDQFRFVALADGLMSVAQTATSGSALDSRIDVFSSTGQILIGDSDSGGRGNSRVAFPVVAGRTYFVRAAGEGATIGNYVLDFNTAPPAVEPPPPEALANVVLKVTGVAPQKLNVRAGPGTEFQILTKLSENQEFVGFNASNGWYQVHIPSRDGATSGWISGTYVATDENAKQVEVRDTGTVGLRVHSLPDLSAPTLTKAWDGQRFVTYGQPAYVLGSTNLWYHVYLPESAGATDGWVSGDYLTTFEPSSSPLPPLPPQPPPADQDDYPNSILSAAPLDSWIGNSTNLSMTRFGQIETAGDADVFLIEAPLTGRMTITQAAVASSSLDSYLIVYDSDSVSIASNDNHGAASDSQLEIAVQAGATYYVKATGAGSTVGNYVLTFETHTEVSPIVRPRAGDLSWSTFLSGRLGAQVAAMTVDAEGNVYVTGTASSGDFPTTPGAFDTAFHNFQGQNNGQDVFVAKLSPTGDRLLYSTFLGGLVSESVSGIAVDGFGNVYVAGTTYSVDFPVTSGAYDTRLDRSYVGSSLTGDAFVTKLSADGSRLIYSTFIGGTGIEEAHGLAVDSSGHAYVAINTSDNQNAGGRGFVAKLSEGGDSLLYSTPFGASTQAGAYTPQALAIDSSDNAFVVGWRIEGVCTQTDSGVRCGDWTLGKLTKLDSTGTVTYARSFGGYGSRLYPSDVAVDSSGNPFMVVNSYGVPNVAEVWKLTPDGTEIRYSYPIGGDIFIDKTGRAVVVGSASRGFPVTSDAYQAEYAGPDSSPWSATDGFVAIISLDGTHLDYATYVGGSGGEGVAASFVDQKGRVILAGSTDSYDFPTTGGAYDPTYNSNPNTGFLNGFVAALTLPSAPIVTATDGFEQATRFGVGNHPIALISADFNRDGIPDVATANIGSQDVSILLGKGDGTFQPAAKYPAGLKAASLATADFNEDGKLDLVVGSLNGAPIGEIAVLLGDDTGGFGPPLALNVGSDPRKVVAADFNHDGHIDVAVASSNTNTVQVLLGVGDGTFNTPVAFGPGGYNSGGAIIAGDFNEDGNLDLVIADDAGDRVWLYVGTGTGALGAPSQFYVGDGPISLVTSDFDHDGHLDLAVANRSSSAVNLSTSSLAVLRGTGKGTFNAPTQYQVGRDLQSVVAADFNQDGNPDLAVVSAYDDRISILMGSGAGTFAAAPGLAIERLSTSLAAIDVDSDGNIDLVSGSFDRDNIQVLLHAPLRLDQASDTWLFGDNRTRLVSPSFSGTARLGVGFASDALVELDIDGDGFDDGSAQTDVFGRYTISSSAPIQPDTARRLVRVRLTDSTTGLQSIASSRIDIDTTAPTITASLAIASDSGTAGDNLTNISQPTFVGAVADAAPFSASVGGLKIELDVDGDGFDDGSGVTQSNGTFSLASTGALANGSHNVRVRAFDQAGNSAIADLTITVDTTPPTVSVSLVNDSGASPSDRLTNEGRVLVDGGDGTATYLLDGQIVSPNASSIIAVTDDGSHTVTVSSVDAAGNSASAHLSFVLDTQAPTVSAQLLDDTPFRLALRQTFALPAEFSRLGGMADLDGDGAVDVVLVNQDANQFQILESNGVTLVPRFTFTYPTDRLIQNAIIADVDGDGRPEVISANWDDLVIFEATADNTYALKFQIRLYTHGANSSTIRVGDFNGNGLKEILVPGAGNPSDVYFVESSGNDQYQQLTSLTGLGYSIWLAGVSDLDGDGAQEVVIYDENATNPPITTSIFENGSVIYRNDSVAGFGIGDTDGNGLGEIIGSNPSTSGNLVILESDGTHGFSQVLFVDGGLAGIRGDSLLTDAVVQDINQDGRAELIFAPNTSNVVSIKTRSGSSLREIWNSGSLFQDGDNRINGILAVSDTNADGSPEVAVMQAGTLYVLEVNHIADGVTNDGRVAVNADNGTTTIRLDGSVVTPDVRGVVRTQVDGSHIVTVSSVDAAGNSASASSNFTFDATPPVFTSSALANVAENTTAVVTVSVTETNLPSQPFSITGGADAAQFTINSATGKLAFVTANPPTDANGDNVYLVQVTATDSAGNQATQTINVTVTYTHPVITVGTANDVVDGDTSSITNLIANNGADGFISLREAIIAANHATGADEITLPAGTYFLSITGTGEDAAATGDLDITDALTITGAGRSTTIIDGGGIDRVMDIFSGAVASISGITIQHGDITGLGGGIRNVGTLTLSNSTITANTASGGGGIWNSGTVLVTGSTISDNSGDSDGGGIHSGGTLTVTNSDLKGNSAFAGAAIFNNGGTLSLSDSTISDNSASNNGGAIMNRLTGSVTITDSTLSGNSAINGGAISCFNTASIAIDNSEIIENTASEFGGGMFLAGDSATSGCSVTITASRISNNVANDSGGILSVFVVLSISDSTISENSAVHFGGGISNNGTLIVDRSMFSDNSSQFGGGIASGSGTVTVTDSTFLNNSAVQGGAIYSNLFFPDFTPTSEVHLQRTTISHNSATEAGGGLAVFNSIVTIGDSSVSDNSASQFGGGIRVADSEVTINNSRITGNSTPGTAGGIEIFGYRPAKLMLNESVVSGNTATYFGGGINNNGILVVNRSTISDNSAYVGGGISSGSGTVTVNDSTLSNNSAVQGGAFYNNHFFPQSTVSSAVTLTNSTISGNTATESGGGVFNATYEPESDSVAIVAISNSTIFGNQSGGAGGGVSNTLNGSIIVANTVIAGNSGQAGSTDLSGLISSSGHNLIGNVGTATGFANGVNGDLVGGGESSAINPQLGPLSDNGGPTKTHAMLLGSPALNAGSALTTLGAAVSDTTTMSISVADATFIATGVLIRIDSEILSVMSISGNSLTVARGQNGTTAITHNSGTSVQLAFDQRGSEFARVAVQTLDIGAFEQQVLAALVNDTGISSSDRITSDGRVLVDGGNGAAAYKLDGQVVTPNASSIISVGGDGSHTVTVTSVNASGYSNNLSLNFTLDMTAPGFTSSATPSVAETSVAVETVSVTDANLPTQPFSITGGADAAKFTINATTGVLAFVTAPDSEHPSDANGDNIYLVQVTASDSAGNETTQEIAVSVTDVNEFSPTVSGGAFNVAENSANGTTVGTVSGLDSDATKTLRYSITGGNSLGIFAIDSFSGAITVADKTNLDREAVSSVTLTVQVSDSGPGSAQTGSTDVTINVTDVNEFNPTVSGGSFSVAENSANGIAVGTVSGSDSDASNGGLSYAITGGNSLGIFAIDSSTGAITVADKTNLDRETISSVTLTIQVSDNGPGSARTGSTDVTINVTDVNEFNPTISGGPFSVAENSANGTSVGSVSGADSDATNEVLSYAITGGNSLGIFAIDSSTGAITVADKTNLDREAISSVTLTVQVSDNGSGSARTGSTDVTINVTDVNEFNPTIGGGPFNVAENSANGTSVGSVSGTDSDATNGVLSYSITGGNSLGIFAIDSSTGTITVADKSNLDREAISLVTLTVQVSDHGPGSARTGSTDVTINVSDVNEFNPTVSGGQFSVAENSANGTSVGTVSGADSDATNGVLSYSIIGGNSFGIFAIDSSTGAITVADKTNLDRETITSVTLTVQVSDDGPGSARTGSTDVTINLSDVNEFNPTASGGPFSVAENSANGTSVGSVNGSDSDSTNGVLSFSITGGNSLGIFAISSSTGAISVADKSKLDCEAISSVTLTVQVSDNGSGSARISSTSVTINVTNLNETPTDIALSSANLVENNATNATVGTFSATDPDASNTFSFSLIAGTGDTDNASFTIVGNALKITPSANFEAQNSYSTLVRVTDQGGLTFDKPFTIAVANSNDSPTLVNVIADQNATVDSAFSFTLPANTFADVDVGDSLTLSATQSDGSALPTWLNFNSTMHTFSGTPANTNLGMVLVKVTATDTSNAPANSTFILTVVTDIAYAATGSAVLKAAVVNNRLQVKVNNVTDTRFDSLDPAFIRSITITGATGADSINLTGLSSSAYSRLTRVSLNGGAGNDTIVGSNFDETIRGGLGNDSLNGAGGTNTLVESGNVNFALTNTSLVGVGTDTLANLQVANLTGGTSTNTFTVSGWTRAGTLVGGGGTGDTIVASKNVNFALSNSVLQTTDGMNLSLSGFTKATLTGGAGNNTFTVGSWTGTGKLTGGTGTDTLSATRNASTTLTTTSLAATGFGTLTLSTLETAQLTGGVGNNLFTVTGWNGTGSLIGGGGTDTVVATRNANFTLSDTQLLASNGLTMTLSGLSIANLAGGSSNNFFTVSGWTGSGLIDGSTGTADQIIAVRDTDMTLTNTSLAGLGITPLTLTAVETAGLSGGNSDNKLIANQFTLGNVTLRGGAGDDVLIGGTKNDTLVGGGGRDLLIGGRGADVLIGDATVAGSSGEDILIGGTTSFNGGTSTTPAAANIAALNAILTEWKRTDLAYAARVSHIQQASSGLNGSTFLNNTTVFNDSGAADSLKGSVPPAPNLSDLDWLFKSTGDLMDTLVAGEISTSI